MNQTTKFGNKSRFAIEVVSIAPNDEFGEIYIYICGECVSDGNPVYLSTFVGEIKAFGLTHQTTPPLNIAKSRLRSVQEFFVRHTFVICARRMFQAWGRGDGIRCVHDFDSILYSERRRKPDVDAPGFAELSN